MIKYNKRINAMLESDIEPDCEDFYLAEIEVKAEKYDSLIKYLEDKIKEFKDKIEKFYLWHEVGVDLNFLILQKQWYQELLEKVRSGKYEQ